MSTCWSTLPGIGRQAHHMIITDLFRLSTQSKLTCTTSNFTYMPMTTTSSTSHSSRMKMVRYFALARPITQLFEQLYSYLEEPIFDSRLKYLQTSFDQSRPPFHSISRYLTFWSVCPCRDGIHMRYTHRRREIVYVRQARCASMAPTASTLRSARNTLSISSLIYRFVSTACTSMRLRDTFSQAREIAFKPLGWSIRYLMVLRDNYFGSFTQFSTLDEYLSKRRRGLPVGDPIVEKYRPGKVRVSTYFPFWLYLTSCVRRISSK
jgi:hypothetical protein